MCSICGFTSCPPGCPNHPDPVIVCPICGQECEDLYVVESTGDVVGCDQCVRKKDALDVIAEGVE